MVCSLAPVILPNSSQNLSVRKMKTVIPYRDQACVILLLWLAKCVMNECKRLLLTVCDCVVCVYVFLINYKFKAKVHVIISLGQIRFSPPLVISLIINGKSINFEVDSGAGATVMNLTKFQEAFSNIKLNKSPVVLNSLSGPIKNSGQTPVHVAYNGNDHVLNLIVCDTNHDFTPLLGRDWLDTLVPDWRTKLKNHATKISSLNQLSPPSLDQLMKLFPRVFDQKADTCIEGFEARLVLKPNARPVFAKAYSLAYGLIEPVNKVLDKMVEDGKAVRVRQAEWASPGLAVAKKDGGVRYCADFKRTLNPQLRVDYYPLPAPEAVFSSLANGAYFTSLDLTDAYTQLALHPDSQDLCILNTHRGLYKLKRLIYGVASAAAIFQSTMDSILLEIEGVICYLDNILIVGKDLAHCISQTYLVLSRLEKHNVRLRLDKCLWFVQELEFLGFKISSSGRSPSPSLLQDILKAKPPTDVKQLRSFLGLINFYLEFLPMFSTLAKPLRKLTELDVPFEWSEECNSAFENCKKLLQNSNLLMHFDPKLPIVVCSDASPVGVGAVLAHVVTINGKKVERPVMFASATLSKTQQNYAQVDREGLAVIFALTRFYKFLWGRPFTIATDNSAIQRILHHEKGLPTRTGHRLQHWAMLLQGYSYKIEHRKSHLMSVPDCLSRLPCDIIINYVSSIIKTPITVEQVAQSTLKDPMLVTVFKATFHGWPSKNPFKQSELLTAFFKERDALSIEQNCLMFGNRVVIPEALQGNVLQILHTGHPGIVRTKSLARSMVWWPSLNEDIEKLCKNCYPCLKVNFKVQSTFIPWPETKYPFERVHIDFFSIKRVTFFIYCDSFSKWLHIERMDVTTAPLVNEVLFNIFAFWGSLPSAIVSDNGPPFDSLLFREFLTRFNIVLKHSPVYHPASNSFAERGVGVAKRALEKLLEDLKLNHPELCTDSNPLIKDRVNSFLFHHRNTPSSQTGKSPNEILLTFRPRTILSQCNPKLRSSLAHPNSFAKFEPQDKVFVKFPGKPTVDGLICRKTGPVTFDVLIGGRVVNVHGNYLERRM
ncbi:uncharacterized protein K02A2.6-like [Frankliniella occidentalis]|uniref:RNA-directed DNA polymerase n=1 Tax=Frankliniella occidentalis TaxID=133901 RepID=A0A9C6XA50_FRAOC|nr:uncharacterized protein K02A2.6-like [Frankliniella occidentalis]XP_052131935.1 uncharacterized protein K02A2.6-like [Frankliniella occidentalis]